MKSTLEIYGCEKAIHLKVETNGKEFLQHDETLGITTGFYITDDKGNKISKYYKSSKAAGNYAVKLIRKDKENGIKTLLVEEVC